MGYYLDINKNTGARYMIITFGKYKNNDIQVVPDDYLQWGIKNLESLKWRDAFKKELDKRYKAQKDEENELKQQIAANSLSQSIIKEMVEKEVNAQINHASEHGYEHEIRLEKSYEDAESIVQEKIQALRINIEIENLKKDFQGKEGLTLQILNKTEFHYYDNECHISRDWFSNDAKFQVACEYMEKLQKIRGW
jgi:hypothetical protein